jgi:hypothetical protein
MRIRLTEEDAERLGVARDLEFDSDKLMGRELIALEDEVGWTVDSLEANLQGEYLTNAIGEPVWETDDRGKVVLDGGGKPMRARGLKAATILVITWLAARRAGCTVPYAEFDFAVTGAEFDTEEPGKAPASPASPTSTTTGKPRSRRSSATRRGSSATA